MTSRPHDVSDLYLAPVALAIDARIAELGQLDLKELSVTVAMASDRPDRTRDMREDALIAAVRYLVDSHGWDFEWDPRGLRLSHGENSVVLGIPATFTDYLAGAAQRESRLPEPA